MTTRKILVHCPEAIYTPHLAAMLLVGRTLANAGCSVALSLCVGSQERCVVKDGNAFPAGQGSQPGLCLDCTGKLIKGSLAYRLPTIDLRVHTTYAMRMEAERVVRATPDDGLRDLTYDGVRFGYHCYQDIILLKKLMWDEALDAEGAAILREQIRTGIVLYLSMKVLLRTHAITDLLVFEQYSQNTTVIEAAKALGIAWRIVTQTSHLNVDRRRIEIRRNSASQEFYGVIHAWSAWRDLPLTPEGIRRIGDDILYRMRGIGSHVYSPGKSDAADIRHTLGLATDRRLIVAYTSSFDEILSQKSLDLAFGNPARPPVPRPFATQHEWLGALVDWVASQDDLQLVIRIHPREDKNKRDGVTSTNYHRLKAQLARTPANVIVVWPADPVSSYDLAEAADQVQTSWSTLGLECARMGIPTVASETDNMTYPIGDFIASGDTAAAFFSEVRRSLDQPAELATVIAAFRFYALSRFHTSFDFGDVVPASDFMGLYPFKPGQASSSLIEAVLEDTTSIAINHRLHAAALADQDQGTAEAAEVRRQLIRLVRFLMTGTDMPEASPPAVRALAPGLEMAALEAEAKAVVAASEGRNATLLHTGGLCAWVAHGEDGEETVRLRYSPLAARLAPLIA